MDDRKLKDRYDDFVTSNRDELERVDRSYRDGFLDGGYAFFADLLGEPSE